MIMISFGRGEIGFGKWLLEKYVNNDNLNEMMNYLLKSWRKIIIQGGSCDKDRDKFVLIRKLLDR